MKFILCEGVGSGVVVELSYWIRGDYKIDLEAERNGFLDDYCD